MLFKKVHMQIIKWQEAQGKYFRGFTPLGLIAVNGDCIPALTIALSLQCTYVFLFNTVIPWSQLYDEYHTHGSVTKISIPYYDPIFYTVCKISDVSYQNHLNSDSEWNTLFVDKP